MNFAFYDLETTGLSKHFDQILQFAAIVTDENFTELDRIDIRCRLAPQVLPSPIALAVTGVSPDQLLDSSSPSYFEFSQTICDYILRWAPSTWVGYNSISFDEEFLRHFFYQTLQPNIYETQFHGNNRLDILLAMQSCWVLNKDLFHWIVKDNGRPVLKLDQMAPANGFTDHDAHDALGDVEATIHMAQIIKKGDPQLWARILENRDKHDVIAKVQKFEPLDLVESYYGNVKDFTLACCCLVGSYSVLFDILNHDPAPHIDKSEEELKVLANQSPRIIRKVAINKVSSLFPSRRNDPELIRRAKLIEDSHEFRRRLQRVIQQEFDEREFEEKEFVEEKAYDGFYSNSDKAILMEFQKSDWANRSNLINRLEDTRLKQLGRRLLVFQGDQHFSEKVKDGAVDYLRNKWLKESGPDGAWITFSKVEEELAEIRNKEMIPINEIEKLEAFYSSVRTQLDQGEIPFL